MTKWDGRQHTDGRTDGMTDGQYANLTSGQYLCQTMKVLKSRPRQFVTRDGCKRHPDSKHVMGMF